LVGAAIFGLVPGLLFAPAAFADVPFASVPSAFASAGTQTVVIASAAEKQTIQRDTYKSEVTETPVTVAASASTNADWAKLVLVDAGLPTSANNIEVILQWMDSENNPQSWWNRNNPLNNGLGSGGGSGFGSYPDLETAASYVAQQLDRSLFSNIAASLAASNPVSVSAQAIMASPWASSHYGYGSLWHAVDVPIVAADASAW
jgi:hypothetical protein